MLNAVEEVLLLPYNKRKKINKIKKQFAVMLRSVLGVIGGEASQQPN